MIVQYGEGGTVALGPFFDIHTHLLCGVDDGATDRETMFSMLDAAYADGTRAICLTPHFTPYLYGDTFDASTEAFGVLRAYAKEKYPDLELFLGHELGYHDGCFDALASGRCRCIADGRYVLVDFPENVDFCTLDGGMKRMMGMGFRPILAHTERYLCLTSHGKWLREFVAVGGIVQLNASSLLGSWGKVAEKQWKTIVKHGLVHLIASDGHNLTTRPPRMSVCFEYLQKKCGAEETERLMWSNAWRVVQNRDL